MPIASRGAVAFSVMLTLSAEASATSRDGIVKDSAAASAGAAQSYLVYVTNEKSDDVTIIDAADNRVSPTWPLSRAKNHNASSDSVM